VHFAAFVASLGSIATVLWDAFETVVLPRNVTRRLRITRLFFRATWRPWARVAARIGTERSRDRFLAIYGPLSLLGLLAVWVLGLLIGFAGLHWSVRSNLAPLGAEVSFSDDLYMSGTTFFTLGLGDLRPLGRRAKLLTVAEAGTGFGVLAIVVAYFPVLYQAFSRRESRLTMLDAWAGSPPSASEVLRRLAERGEIDALNPFLRDWEYWCSDLLESHISYPAVAFFRSQHQRQSWVSALAALLDLSALVEVGIQGVPKWQAHVTFAMARHAAVDLSQVLHSRLDVSMQRLTSEDLERLRRQLEAAGLRPARSEEADQQLNHLRRSYEPYVCGLARALMMPLPPWFRLEAMKDNWQVSAKSAESAHL